VVKEALDALGVDSWVKTSGASRFALSREDNLWRPSQTTSSTPAQVVPCLAQAAG